MKWRSRARARAIFAALTIGVIGCQIIIPSDVPEFRCVGEDPSSCPSGLICVRGDCLPPSTETGDGGSDGRGEDARPDADADSGPFDLGGRCVGDVDCKAGLLCGTSTILTAAMIRSGSVCTKSCCSSADCADGFVCFATGTGGNYCVSAASADRTPTANGAAPGEDCTRGNQCRSGLCRDGRCLDTCCGDDECKAGTVCRITSVEGPTLDGGTVVRHTTWACALGNVDGKDNGDTTCLGSLECKNNNCAFSRPGSLRCNPTCCNANDCTALPGLENNVCGYATSGTDRLKQCFEPNSDGKVDGTPCVSSSDCQSRFCDAVEPKTCVRPCCTNADCPAGQGCRPSPQDTPFLRCVPEAL